VSHRISISIAPQVLKRRRAGQPANTPTQLGKSTYRFASGSSLPQRIDNRIVDIANYDLGHWPGAKVIVIQCNHRQL
jgi:hypothetical protein